MLVLKLREDLMDPKSWLFLTSLSKNSSHLLSEGRPVYVSLQFRLRPDRASVSPVAPNPHGARRALPIGVQNNCISCFQP